MKLFSPYYKKYKYREYDGLSDSNVPLYKPVVEIGALRKSGQTKVVHTEDGDQVSCNIVYRTDDQLVEHSMLDGHEIMESVPINALMLDTGYLNYVK